MHVAYGEIARVLAAARRRQAWVSLAAALGFGAVVALGWLLVGAAALGRGAPPVVRFLSLAGVLFSLGGALVWAAREIFGKRGGELVAARTVTASDPSLQSDLLSSVELEGARQELARSGRFSLALVDAHIERTAANLDRIDLILAIPSRRARRAGYTLLAALAIQSIALVLPGAEVTKGYKRLFRGDGEAALAPPRLEPITGDVELTYLYPSYMGRPSKKLSGTGGGISAPKGTEVRLEARSDRPVTEAQLVVNTAAGVPVAASPLREGGTTGKDAPKAEGAAAKVYALGVSGGRVLSGRFVVQDGGSYQFRFLRSGKMIAEGPPIPIAIEPDEFPQVHITAPPPEVEIDGRGRIQVAWNGSDDFGLSELVLVLKPPSGEEQRRPLRTFTSTRRDSGTFALELAPLRLDEGEKLLYWLEIRDNDTVSGPKRAASATQTVKSYSETEHRRATLEKAQVLWEELVRLLGDRLEQLPGSADPVAVGEQLDTRARQLQERIRGVVAELRREPAVPPELVAGLDNVAGSLRTAAERLSTTRQTYARFLRTGRGNDPVLARRLAELDEEMTRELEKDVLYLEALFDKQRGEDLVRLAKEFAARRRTLATLMEKYRNAPTEQGKKELLAEVARLKRRMQELMRRMADLAKGISDQHMNAEALAELSKSRDLAGNLERVEKQLARGDLDSAMKELDALGSSMQQMLSSLERTAGMPAQRNGALMKEMMAFKRRLEELQAEQEGVAGKTERVKSEYRRQISERLNKAEPELKRLEQLARRALHEVLQTEKGVSIRSEEDFGQSRSRLEDTERALIMRDLDAALESLRRALPAMQRLSIGLDEDAAISDRYQQPDAKESAEIREAQRHAQAALPPARKLQEELERLFPDPRNVLDQGEQSQLEKLSKQQEELQRQAGGLQQELQRLMQKAPVFPPSAERMVEESRGHMQQAAEDLGHRNPQRGHGQQRQALDELGRLRKGMEEMARRAGGREGGFPVPFAESGSGTNGEDGGMPSQEKVEIPGAEANRASEEFRKDLLEAMKQGMPEPYQSEVRRYYQELVK